VNSDTPILSLASQQITPARLAWIMDVGDRTVWEWNDQNLITRFQRGRIIRFAPESVLEFIIGNTVRTRSKPTMLVQTLGAELSAQQWARIERLIADQMEAKTETLKFKNWEPA
jgi:hypothetical protein